MSIIFACWPVYAFWNKGIKGNCISINLFYHWQNGLSVLIDVLVFALPLYPLWQLQAPRSKKIGLTLLFLLASIGMIMSIVRWVEMLNHDATLIRPSITVVIVSWVVVEPSVYLITCCLAGCGSLFTASKKFVSKPTGFTRSGGNGGLFELPSRGVKPTGFAQLNEESA